MAVPCSPVGLDNALVGLIRVVQTKTAQRQMSAVIFVISSRTVYDTILQKIASVRGRTPIMKAFIDRAMR